MSSALEEVISVMRDTDQFITYHGRKVRSHASTQQRNANASSRPTSGMKRNAKSSATDVPSIINLGAAFDKRAIRPPDEASVSKKAREPCRRVNARFAVRAQNVDCRMCCQNLLSRRHVIFESGR